MFFPIIEKEKDMDTEWNDETDKVEDDKILKVKVLNSMLKKGYIDEEKYRKKLEDKHFTANDAATYYDIADAYADKRYITYQEFERRMEAAVKGNKSDNEK